MFKFLVRNDSDCTFLYDLHLMRAGNSVSASMSWSPDPSSGLFFEYDEAQAVIVFICDVIDWELSENLSVVFFGAPYEEIF